MAGSLQQRSSGRFVRLRQGHGPPTGAPAGFRGVEPGPCSFPDDGAFEFRQRAKEVKDQRPPGGTRVDRFGEGAQADLPTVQGCDRVEQLPQRPRQPVELPDDQRVPGTQIVEGGMQLGPIALRATGFLRIDFCTARRLQDIELQGEILVVGRDAGRADVQGHGGLPRWVAPSLRTHGEHSKGEIRFQESVLRDQKRGKSLGNTGGQPGLSETADIEKPSLRLTSMCASRGACHPDVKTQLPSFPFGCYTNPGKDTIAIRRKDFSRVVAPTGFLRSISTTNQARTLTRAADQ